jgi:hypothetical protein
MMTPAVPIIGFPKWERRVGYPAYNMNVPLQPVGRVPSRGALSNFQFNDEISGLMADLC